MVPRSTVLDSDSAPELLFVVALTTGILFLGGLTTVYQSVLRENLQNTFTLSPVEWAVFSFGAFLLEPVLLFGALYYVGFRSDGTVPLTTFLPGLGVAAVVGTLFGQYVGIQVWGSAVYSLNDVPFTQARGGLFVLEPPILGFWRVLVEPLVRDFLTAVAALGLARTTD